MSAMMQAGNDDVGYIRNGLVFQLDGIDKGTDNTSKWVDLVGGITFTEVGGNNIHDTNCITLPGSRRLTGSSSPAFASTTHTIEIAMYPQQVGWQGIVAFKPSSVALYQDGDNYIHGGYMQGTSSNFPRTNGKVSTANKVYLLGFARGNYMLNGAYSTSTMATANRSGMASSVIGSLSSTANSYTFKGKIYAIRVYNRLLTEDELRHNQQVDNERFNLNLTINT